jgi:opacity protein-like surface antigen
MTFDTPRHRPARHAASALLALAFATPCVADAGPYVTAQFGIANQSDQSFTLRNGANAQARSIALDSGGLAGASAGWDFGNGWRAEGEFIYQSVDAGNAGFAAPAGPTGGGDYASTGFAANLLYEFDLFGSERARTYVGAGLVRLTEIDADFTGGTLGGSYSGSGNGWQVLFGARYDLGERWFVDAGLRWLRASDIALDPERANGASLRADYEPWAATVALGWRF